MSTITPGMTFLPFGGPTVIEIWDRDLETRLAAFIPWVTETAKIDHPVSDTGLLTLQLGLDETAHAFLVNDNNLRVVIDDQDVFTGRIEPPIKEQLVHIDGAAMKVAEVSCRGYVAELEDTTIDPYGGIDAKPQALTRPMNWCSPEADLSGLDPAAVLFSALSVPWRSPQTDPPWFSPWLPPKGYPDPTTHHIWASLPDPVTGHPVQTRRFVKDITIPADGLYQFWCFADDGFTLFGNGIKLGEGNLTPGDTFIIPWSGCWNLTAGTLRVGIEGYNYDKPTAPPLGTFGGPNIGRVGFALYHLVDGVDTVLDSSMLVAHTDGTWLTKDTDDPLPAPSWGSILTQLFNEEQLHADSPAAGYVLDFTGTHDSSGNAWTARDGASFGVADDTSLLSVLRTGATSGCIDWFMDPTTKTLHVTNFGEWGSPHAATFTETDGTLIDLQRTSVPSIVNSLKVRSKTGLEVVEDSGSIATHGRKQRSLPLADLDADSARTQALRDVAVRSQPQDSFTAAIEVTAGTSDAPYGPGGWWPGDSPTFGTDQMRAVRISTTFDVGGNPTFVPELQTRMQSAAEREQIALSKAGASLNGTSRAATPLEGMTSGVVAGFVQLADTITFTQDMLTPAGQEATYDVSARRKWAGPARIHRVDIEQGVVPQTTATIAHLIRSNLAGNTTIATLTLPVGFAHAIVLPEYCYVGQFDNIHLEIVQHDTALNDPTNPLADARWLVVNCYAVDANPATVQAPKVDVPW